MLSKLLYFSLKLSLYHTHTHTHTPLLLFSNARVHACAHSLNFFFAKETCDLHLCSTYRKQKTVFFFTWLKHDSYSQQRSWWLGKEQSEMGALQHQRFLRSHTALRKGAKETEGAMCELSVRSHHERAIRCLLLFSHHSNWSTPNKSTLFSFFLFYPSIILLDMRSWSYKA